MPHAALDIRFHSNPKILTAGNAAAGLYARALSYCADNLTDGFVTDAWTRSAGKPAETKRLVDSGLFVKVEGGYLIPDYLDFNFSKEKVKELIEQKREAGKASAEARRKARDAQHTVEHSAEHSVEQPPNETLNEMFNGSSNETATEGQPLTFPPNPSPSPSFKNPGKSGSFKDLNSEVIYALGKISEQLRDADDDTITKLSRAAKGLSTNAVFDVLASVKEMNGAAGTGYAINALKKQRKQRDAAPPDGERIAP